MNVLITGGAGYIGSELVQYLANQNEVDKITVYDNLLRNNYNIFIGNKLNSKLEFINGDILDSRKLRQSVDSSDVIVHLAAKVSTPLADSHSHEFDQINNWGTAELSYALDNYSNKKIIYASSISIYGSKTESSNVKSTPHPKTFYGISKLRGEEHIERLFETNNKAIILRCANVYGFGSSIRLDSVINKFAFNSFFNNKILINGSGEQKRTFVNISRLISYFNDFIFNEYDDDIYNLVEESFSIREIADTIKEININVEMIFANQNMKMKNLVIERDDRLSNLINQNISLKDDLIELISHFSK